MSDRILSRKTFAASVPIEEQFDLEVPVDAVAIRCIWSEVRQHPILIFECKSDIYGKYEIPLQRERRTFYNIFVGHEIPDEAGELLGCFEVVLPKPEPDSAPMSTMNMIFAKKVTIN